MPQVLGARTPRGLGLATVGALGLATLLLVVAPGGGSPAARGAGPGPVSVTGGTVAAATDATVLPTAGIPQLDLNVGVAPVSICTLDTTGCSAGVGEARVQLSATPLGTGTLSWPAVQVAFVLETTSYDGDYGTDSSGLDPCAGSYSSYLPVCEESNAIPFFVDNAASIAVGIQQENPHSAVSFALVDHYDAWSEPWDDQDGPEYNVDIGQFVPASEFGSLVHSTFQQTVLQGGYYNWDQDMDNNILDSSQITALYGAIIGSNLNWTANAHHVIVWIGSTAPRDPSYLENYCVSASAWNQWGQPGGCYSQSCEPSYHFSTGASPQCEGWVRSQDGNPQDSIAALAHTAPACVTSVGGVCTIDLVDLWTTSTDPYSEGWPTQFSNRGGGPGGPMVLQNAARVIQAGCDLAAATGGTWDGPAFASCPNGQMGTLQYVSHGRIDRPDTANPSLFTALRQIGFGPVSNGLVVAGAHAPMFVFVPFGNIAVAAQPRWAVACETEAGFEADCQRAPTVLQLDGVTAYGWNWSTNASRNSLHVGDVWSASFNVMATGPPVGYVPVDACTLPSCAAAGSRSESGFFTWAHYLQDQNRTETIQSFPVALVDVISPPVGSAPSAPPPPPPAPPPPALPIPGAQPISAPLPVAVQTALSTVSLQAATAGLLGAGFMRVTVRNRPIALAVAAKSGAGRSRFDGIPPEDGRFGRFE